MATFVFVAGGFHGGWCWQRVAMMLRELGHEVFTPSLTGLADRSHLFGPNIGLETHITDIANLLEWEDLSNVHLVGHSYAGAIITAVADRDRERVRQVVYFDALWPENGDTVEFLISGREMAEGVLNNAASEESGPVLAWAWRRLNSWAHRSRRHRLGCGAPHPSASRNDERSHPPQRPATGDGDPCDRMHRQCRDRHRDENVNRSCARRCQRESTYNDRPAPRTSRRNDHASGGVS